MSGQSPAPAGFSPEPGREGRMTTAPVEARSLVELIAGPLRLGENVKGALSRVARTTGLPNRRVRGIWHQEARTIRSEEMDRLRQAARDARAVEKGHDAYRATTALIDACEAAVRVPREDLDRPADPRLGPEPGGVDRALDRTARPMTGPAPHRGGA